MKFLIISILIITLFSCSDKKDEKKEAKVENIQKESMSFSKVESNKSGINFKNSITDTETFNFFNYEYIYNGGGVAVGDINNDGLVDIYFSGNQVSDRLYINKGNLKFEDITENAIGDLASEGWHTGVTMVDINGDDYLDIYVSRAGIPENKDLMGNLLFINNHDNTFSEKGAEYGVNIKRKTTQSAFLDIDNDGDLDLYVMNHPIQDVKNKKSSVGAIMELIAKGSPDSDVLLENIDGKFVDITKQAGLANHSYGLGLSIADINNDGYQDLYVSNDYMAPDFLYINNGDGTFTDQSIKMLKHMSNFAMGNDISDFNNDGLLDIMTVDMASEDHVRSKKNMAGMSTKKFWETVSVGYHFQYMFNSLQLNNGDGTTSEIAQLSRISKTDWSWAPLFVDFDNDGYKDLFISNGYRRDSRNNDYISKVERGVLKDKNYHEKLALIPTTKTQNYIYKNDKNLHFDKMMKNLF